jgi:hypothetical protein
VYKRQEYTLRRIDELPDDSPLWRCAGPAPR